jgi:transglutaminase-like putative cysteine protease
MDPHEALAETDASSEGLLAMTAVRPRGAAVYRGAERMRIRIGNAPDELTIPEDDTQRVANRWELEIVTPEAPVMERLTLPVADPALDAYLGSDAFVQAGHEEIAAKARAIVDGEDDLWAAATRLYDWLYANIEKVSVVSIPSALDVLRSGEGDCNEHTVLYAAMARSVGIPTRIAIGLVWSDDLNAFYYHAWPEVYAGRWTWLDPTLGQIPADATHIKLLTGSVAQWTDLMGYVGRIELEVLDIE